MSAYGQPAWPLPFSLRFPSGKNDLSFRKISSFCDFSPFPPGDTHIHTTPAALFQITQTIVKPYLWPHFGSEQASSFCLAADSTRSHNTPAPSSWPVLAPTRPVAWAPYHGPSTHSTGGPDDRCRSTRRRASLASNSSPAADHSARIKESNPPRSRRVLARQPKR